MNVITDFFTSTFCQICTYCQDPEAMQVMRRTLLPALIMAAIPATGLTLYAVGLLFY